MRREKEEQKEGCFGKRVNKIEGVQLSMTKHVKPTLNLGFSLLSYLRIFRSTTVIMNSLI